MMSNNDSNSSSKETIDDITLQSESVNMVNSVTKENTAIEEQQGQGNNVQIITLDSGTDTDVSSQELNEGAVVEDPAQIAAVSSDIQDQDTQVVMFGCSEELLLKTRDDQVDMEVGESNENSLEGSKNGDDESVNSPTSTKNTRSISDVESDGSASSSSPDQSPKKKRRKTGTRGSLHPQALKKSKNPFVQSKSCLRLKYALGKCMECRLSKSIKHPRKESRSECRFYLFRKLRYTKRGSLTVAGFPDISEYTSDDLIWWMPDNPPKGLNLELAKYLLEQVGDQFCELVRQEKQALISLERQESEQVVWRKAIESLREMCDVCSTTLFNYHWTCNKCGFVVCVSCFKARSNKNSLQSGVKINDIKDTFGWLKCHMKNEHKIEELMLTQIVAGRALDILWSKSHDIRIQLKIHRGCCSFGRNEETVPFLPDCSKQTASEKEITNNGAINGTTDNNTQQLDDSVDGEMCLPASDVNGKNDDLAKGDKEGDDGSDDDDDQEGIMDLFGDEDEDNNFAPKHSTEDKTCSTVPNAPDNDTVREENSEMSLKQVDNNNEMELKNFIRREGNTYSIKIVAKKIVSLVESSLLYPTVKHSWLCSGHLLRLLEAKNADNLKMFQEQWRRGQPVIVSNVSSMLDTNLWSPESFSRDFGSKSNDLINCMTGKVVPGQKMKKFWDGFQHVKMRLRDENCEPMLLKLKDWPPGHDFAEMLPNRFADLMKALPLKEYTHRDGKLNLAARLPSLFSKPDLGPKMYIAYGSGLHLDKGTTNLHLDISDAVNVMVYVGDVKDEDTTDHDNAVKKAIEESDCDSITIQRVRIFNELPGALWHIWEAKDADKIRDMLNKVALESGKKVEQYHDAIHDQSWYLDRELRSRLRKEYNVSGYPILQCAGDAVFIPAGAPHQVRNLNICIKIAEDFVSPENVGHCFHLTEEFRNLTDTHTNHEDKLQIKNIVYHTVKDAVAVIQAAQTDSAKKE